MCDQSPLAEIENDPVALQATTQREVYAEAVEQCRQKLPRADRVLLLMQEAHNLEIKGSYGSKAAFAVTNEVVSRSIIRRVRRTRRAILISDALADDEIEASQSMQNIGQRSVICVPLNSRGNTIGILYADSMSMVGAFVEAEFRWSLRMATAIGRSLNSIKTLEESTGRTETSPSEPAATTNSSPSSSPASGAVPVDDPEEPPTLKTRYPKPSFMEKVSFFRSLACMLEAGVTVTSALRLLGESTSRVAPFSADLVTELEKGRKLSSAMSQFPDVFELDYRNLISIGETSGTLDRVTETVASALESEMSLRGKIFGALTYPAMIAAFCLLGVLAAPSLFLNDYFEALANENTQLPILTQMVMALSKILGHPLSLVLLAATAILPSHLTKAWRASFKFREKTEKGLLKLPGVGPVYHNFVILKFVRALGLQLEAGLRVDRALKLSAQATGSPRMQTEIHQAVERLMAGESLAFSLSRCPLFDKTLAEFIRVGEETGRVGEMCAFVEKLLTMETEHAIEVGQSLIEPLSMAVVGILVGTLALACLLPLVKMIQDFL